jgi:hypothetical protein
MKNPTASFHLAVGPRFAPLISGFLEVHPDAPEDTSAQQQQLHSAVFWTRKLIGSDTTGVAHASQ